MFFCELAPESGGETPIVLSNVVYKRMSLLYPELVEKLEDGLVYSYMLGEEDDKSSILGRGWKSTFQTDNKRVAEERLVVTLIYEKKLCSMLTITCVARNVSLQGS